jgi:hypothetical protein
MVDRRAGQIARVFHGVRQSSAVDVLGSPLGLAWSYVDVPGWYSSTSTMLMFLVDDCRILLAS